MLYGMHKNPQQVQLTSIFDQDGKRKRCKLLEKLFIIGARVTGASVTKPAHLASVSIGTVTRVTSAFRSLGKTSVNGVENCS